MKILVIGAGAVGGYFGGLLANSGEDVTFVARGKYLDSLRTAGLKIRSYKGDLTLKINAIENPESLGEFDVILMCVKSQDTEKTTLQCIDNIGDSTVVISLQNGVDNEGKIGNIIGREKVLGGVVFLCSELNKSWEICHHASGKLTIGELDGKISDRVKNIAGILEKSEIPCSISDNIYKELWKKLTWNAGFNSVSAITQSTMGEMVDCEETKSLIRLTMNEVLDVAKGLGYNLSNKIIEEYLEPPKELRNAKTSTLQDIIKCKNLEIDAISGAVITNGKRLGIDTPYNSSLYALLKIINNRY